MKNNKVYGEDQIKELIQELADISLVNKVEGDWIRIPNKEEHVNLTLELEDMTACYIESEGQILIYRQGAVITTFTQDAYGNWN